MGSASCTYEAPALVAGFDFHANAWSALRHAVGMLRCGAVSELHVVHVVPTARSPDRARALRDAIAEQAADLTGRDVASRAWVHLRNGHPRHEVRRLAFDVGAEIVALGAPRSGRPLDVEAYRPFSVLIAGEELELHGGGFRASRCADCLRHRARAVHPVAFCPEHLRLDDDPVLVRWHVEHRSRVVH